MLNIHAISIAIPIKLALHFLSIREIVIQALREKYDAVMIAVSESMKRPARWEGYLLRVA